MYIAYDISQTGSGKAGCGYYAHAMVEALIKINSKYEYRLCPSFGDFWFDQNMPISNPYKEKHVHYGPKHKTREEAGVFWNAFDVEQALGNPNIIHANNFWCPVQIRESRLVYTFYDMGFVVNPDWTTETNRVSCFDGVFRSSIVADHVIAISEASREHYLQVFPHFPPERISTIYPCSRFMDASVKGQKPKLLDGVSSGMFWLNVGTIEPRKNQHCLAAAYARYLGAGGTPMPLVFAGGAGWLMEDFQAYLRKLGIEEKVIMTGYVSDDELVWLYRNCFANIYPSLFEGFGLPVLEGMQFGAPSIASNSTSIPEVAGDAAVLVAPQDVSGISNAMMNLDRDREERNRLHLMALGQAEKFKWTESAGKLLEIYQEVVKSSKRNR